MSIKLIFVFGLLLASGWTQEEVLEPDKVSELVKESSVNAKAEVNLGNENIDDENLNKDVDENVEKTENGVKASGISKLNIFCVNL